MPTKEYSPSCPRDTYLSQVRGNFCLEACKGLNVGRLQTTGKTKNLNGVLSSAFFFFFCHSFFFVCACVLSVWLSCNVFIFFVTFIFLIALEWLFVFVYTKYTFILFLSSVHYLSHPPSPTVRPHPFPPRVPGLCFFFFAAPSPHPLPTSLPRLCLVLEDARVRATQRESALHVASAAPPWPREPG